MTATNVLIVEDQVLIAKGIEKRLKALGYAVAGVASTGEGAIQQARDVGPDLILMDIHLGRGMDGVEAADRIRRQRNVPVVFLTAHSDAATLQRAKLAEPFGYVLKPFEDKDLQTAIEIGLHKHKMEARVRENEQWLAATLGSIGDAVIATDERGRVRFMNAPAEQLTGWTQADAHERNVGEVFNIVEAQSRQLVPNPASEALGTDAPVPNAPNTVLIDKDGAERAIDNSAAQIRDVNGKATGAVLVFRDVSERRRLERQVADSQRELEAANADLALLATTDGLTSLKNRRAFKEALISEVKRAHRSSVHLSLLLLDVDHFKQFNDTFGHPAGDRVLCGVSRLLEANVRSTDFLARYGGEEFAVLLPDTDQRGAIQLAERVRRGVEAGDWTDRKITISVGVATLNLSDGTDNELIEDADRALYRSKKSGRNCVSHSELKLAIA